RGTSCTTVLVFVDTNVFVYRRDAGYPAKQTVAADWISRLWRERTGRTSMQVVSEYYVTLTRKLVPRIDAADAWGDVEDLLSWQPAVLDDKLIRVARDVAQRHHLSWWDSMIVASAQIQDCRLLLSEDLQDGGDYGGVIVRNPFSLAVNAPLPDYTPKSGT